MIYTQNFPVMLPFIAALVISLPLALILPNFIASSGIFLRYESLQQDFNWIAALLVFGSFVLSMLLFSFAIVAINLKSLSQRTSTSLKSWQLEAIEEKVARLFIILVLFFAFSFIINILLFELNLHYTLGLIVSFIISALILFTPQAIVLDELNLNAAIKKSASIVFGKISHSLFFFGIAIALVLFNTSLFVLLQGVIPFASIVSVIVNGALVVPFLEVLKAQVYLSKYALI